MKLGLLLFASLFLFACESSSSKEPVILTFLPNISDNPKIFGTWTMCSTSDGFNMIQFNVCPQITFQRNGIGQISKSGLSMDQFRFSLEKNNLKLYPLGTIQNSIFRDSSYLTRLSIGGGHDDYFLVISNSYTEYYLSRGE